MHINRQIPLWTPESFNGNNEEESVNKEQDGFGTSFWKILNKFLYVESNQFSVIG